MKCFDCGNGPIVTLVCRSCENTRQDRDGEGWLMILFAERGPIEGVRDKARKGRERKQLRDWQGNAIG